MHRHVWRQLTRRLEHLTACCGHVLRNRSATMQTGIQWKSTKHSLCIGWTISCASARVVIKLYARPMSHINSGVN